MILADKLIKLRKQSGWSQEELAEKMNVSRQSISKWEGAQSIPDLNRILKLSEIFHVSTDYLLKDEIEDETPVLDSYEPFDGRRITAEEANTFIEADQKNSRHIAIGAILCILSPVVLILLGTLSEVTALSENAAVCIGLLVLFSMIACAVVIFVKSDSFMRPYKFLETDEFTLDYGVSGILHDKLEQNHPSYIRKLCIGIVLCIVCSVPLIVAGALEAPDIFVIAMLSLLLIMVSCATFLLITGSSVKAACEKLLQIEDYSKEKKEANKRTAGLSGFYWCSIVCIYLGTSFSTNAWDKTWIVWPIAGVLFAAICHLITVVISNKNS